MTDEAAVQILGIMQLESALQMGRCAAGTPEYETQLVLYKALAQAINAMQMRILANSSAEFFWEDVVPLPMDGAPF